MFVEQPAPTLDSPHHLGSASAGAIMYCIDSYPLSARLTTKVMSTCVFDCRQVRGNLDRLFCASPISAGCNLLWLRRGNSRVGSTGTSLCGLSMQITAEAFSSRLRHGLFYVGCSSVSCDLGERRFREDCHLYQLRKAAMIRGWRSELTGV
jgi:hypothetical protein